MENVKGLEVVVMKVDDLKPYEKNARKHGERDVKAIAASIEEFGFNDPVGIWSDENLIVEGHGRVLAAKMLGMETVPCIRLDHLTDEQRRAYALAHNKTAENSIWDATLVAAEIKRLPAVDMSKFGFDLSNFVPADKKQNNWFQERERWEEADEDDDNEYKDFVDKFKPKKTTDDCYTPDNIYETMADYVAQTYGLNRENFVRPFYPGGDYQNEEYKAENVVVDNPPFSLLAEIIAFYCERGIRFFLFAPNLTLFTGWKNEVCYIATNADITYENGAIVRTSFVTNLEKELQVRTAPELYKILTEEDDKNRKAAKVELPKYYFPDNVLTAAMAGRWAQRGVEYKLAREDCVRISTLDAMKEKGKDSIYGGGFLLSEKAAAERAAAERAAAERWQLSEREKRIVASLGKA